MQGQEPDSPLSDPIEVEGDPVVVDIQTVIPQFGIQLMVRKSYIPFILLQ